MNGLNLPPEQRAIRDKCFHPSGTFVEFPIEDVETSIPARFEKIARLYPERIAVKTETCVATYSQLNDMANQFAHALLQSQGSRAQLVAILLDKDAGQVAAMMGAMKAGKFFLILDPSFPKTRLATMLKESRANLVVTNRQNASLADEITTGACQLMQWEALDSPMSEDNPELSIAPKALAFVNYTSGSTGEPKGLLRSHRMILHNIMLRTNLAHICEHDRISLLSSGTSNAITNSLLALLNGAGLYSLEIKKEGVARLGSWLREESITIAPMSSPLFRNLCETLKGNYNFPDLRVLRLRSEAVFKSDLGLYQQFFSPKCIFVTGLSSNETGPLADYLIDHDTVVTDSAVPVGYAAPGKELLLLNQDGETIGFDEVGEIAVRSRYLSPGYLRNPKLAKSKFKLDPSENGSRVYLTGDMGLRLSDGCLIHKGRKDFRVKVRGYPVDLKEVETTLRSHPSIHDSVITTRTNQSGETTLIAYFVTTSRQTPGVSELVRFLGQTLPDYMIPGAFVKLESLPLNPQNKIDRAALPLPAETRPCLDTPFMAPRDETERQLAEIWAEVLGIDRLGILDNFFDLGGHSLTATRVVTRVIDKFHLELPLQALFDAPSVEKMAAVITENQSVGHKPSEILSSPSSDVLEARPVGTPIDSTPFPKENVERSVPERFEKIVRMYPDRIAVKTDNEQVTYAQLNAMANAMAHKIVAQRGTEPEAVAILMGKGARLMAAMLAVLKAGKFFVLLDSSTPKVRITSVLEDSQASLIIFEQTFGELSQQLELADSKLVEFESTASHYAQENLRLNILPDSLAAIIYTSGSTGEPKGVIWAQRNLLHQCMLFTNAYILSEFDKLLLTTSGTGNAVVIGFLALLNGAALLPFDVQAHGVNRLVKWIRDEKISICWIGPPLFRNICQTLAGDAKFPNIRVLRLASEASHKRDIDLYKQYFPPDCLLINGLSNTEAGLVCLYQVDLNTGIPGQEIPVGYAVEDKEVVVLDDYGKEVGFNEVGEIAVRSRYLSPGYWRRAELTTNRFIPDPDGSDQRIYLTGDLGVKLPDGCLIHKGRKDFRIKVRGYGVELAAVETILASHAAVGQAVVVALDKDNGEARLVAYYTRTELPAPTVSELRDFLKAQLPEYMIPVAFVRLDRIPLTPSGKIDRRALPDPQNVRPDLATTFVASQSEIEKKLVSIWEDVLDVRPIGVNDRFYDLGGDSLSATRVMSQVFKQFRTEIPLRSLFQSPTIADMAAVIALQQNQLTEHDRPNDVAASSVVRESQQASFPLSFSQQRLWFLDQLDPGSFTYNLFSAYLLKGELNVAALEHSFNEIVRRHDILRTVFKSEDGNPLQIVLPTLTIKIPLFDLRATVLEKERWSAARRIFTEEAQRPFDLGRGPLLRITLLQLADDEYLLLRAMHHIVSDGWSVGVLSRELSDIYQAVSTGKPSPLADLPTQYADFATWQKQRLQGERLEPQLSYWKTQLENLTTLKLPTDHPRQAFKATNGARRYFALSPRLCSELKKLSHQQGATLFMTLLAAFQTLLHRYSGQTDIVVGSPVAGRIRKEFEELIGFFLNTLVLRLDLSDNPTFIETIRRAREICLQALSHQELPFEKLVEELHPDRNVGRNPLFQVTFAFQNSPRVSPRLSGMKVDEMEVETGIARFDLHLFIEEIDGHLKGYFDYDRNLFDAATIERLIGHFQILLEGIVSNPDQRISELPLLTEAEKHQLLVEWNDTETDYPKDKCIHQLFEAQVEKTPDAIALVFENQQLTYGQLNQRANQLAHHLKNLGVVPEVLVGIFVERSIELVVGILGILKSGGAYVPLDPSLPKERLEFMLIDSQVRFLLSHQKLSLDIARPKAVWLDRDWHEIAKQAIEPPSCSMSSENLAYVIYTSGSTGTPKGVMIPHRGLVNYLSWAAAAYDGAIGQGAPLHSSIGFDLSITSLLTPLLVGRRVVILPEDQGVEPLSSLLRSETNFSLIKVTPAHLDVLRQELPAAELDQCTRTLIIGGDALTFEKLEVWSKYAPRVRLINEYGPTETVVGSCMYEVARGLISSGPVPIGRPIANTQIYILDQHLQPVPIGVTGEIHIGGDGLARGYLNRPELTIETFIANPFSGEPGAKLYKTGDLARYRPDGNIEFLGRIDNQVKIRGYRIELGEIETVLAQHPAVQQAVVLASEDIPNDRRLVAYIAVSGSCNPSTHDLRSFLQHKLPDYMMPSAFVFLESLPLTPNGKLDRKALPAPEHSRPELDDGFVAPSTPVEETLAKIWTEVLKLDKVGIHDNFFHLRGHSLLATQVVSRVRESFKLDLPLRTLFEAPTIEGIAQRLQVLRDKQEVAQIEQIAPASREQYRIQ